MINLIINEHGLTSTTKRRVALTLTALTRNRIAYGNYRAIFDDPNRRTLRTNWERKNGNRATTCGPVKIRAGN